MRAGKPKEAIDMYCHQQDWAAALNVANTSDPASVPSICALQVGALHACCPSYSYFLLVSCTVALALSIACPLIVPA